MPKSLEPGARIPIVLKSDQGKKPCPTFFSRSLSVRAFRDLLETLATISESDDKTTQTMLALDQVCSAIVGWENMIDPDTKQPIPFSKEKLTEVIDLMEAIELMEHITKGNVPSEEEQKKSAPLP